jgi:hypothetical protein
VQRILQAFDTFGPDVVTNARQVAEMTAGRKLANAEWGWMGFRWERAWSAIVPAMPKAVPSVPTVVVTPRRAWWPWRRAGGADPRVTLDLMPNNG